MAIWFSRERLWGLCVSWLLAEPGGSDQISTARTNPRTLRYQGSIVQGNKTPGSPLTLNFLKQAWEDRVRQWGTNIFPIPWCMKSKKGKLQVKGVLRETPFQLAFHTCHSPSKELLQLGKASKLMGGFLTVHVRFNERGHVSIYHTEQKAEHSISILWGLIYGAFKITLIPICNPSMPWGRCRLDRIQLLASVQGLALSLCSSALCSYVWCYILSHCPCFSFSRPSSKTPIKLSEELECSFAK